MIAEVCWVSWPGCCRSAINSAVYHRLALLVLGELRPSAHLHATRYIPGPAIDRPIAMIDYTSGSPVTSYFYTDRQGSVVAMSDSAGNPTEGPYTYSEFGECQSGGQDCSGGVPYKYTGRRYDAETGLYYYRARYYSARLGRFLQTDPIGYKDDLNWYAYVGNDPTDKTDPTGREIVVMASPENRAEYNNAVQYMMNDPGFAKDYGQLQSSDQVYRIYVSEGNLDVFNGKTNNIGWDPKSGLQVKDGVQSPALGLRHEVDHAAEKDRTGKVIPLTHDGKTATPEGAREERRAVSDESKTAKNLGEPTRSSPNEGTPVRVPTSTTSCTRTKEHPC